MDRTYANMTKLERRLAAKCSPEELDKHLQFILGPQAVQNYYSKGVVIGEPRHRGCSLVPSDDARVFPKPSIFRSSERTGNASVEVKDWPF
jgi:hypothetical protein